VKYARMLEPRSLGESAAIAFASGADAVVVTGAETGAAPRAQELSSASAAAGPVLIGSGLTSQNAEALLAVAGGAIVGTALKTGDRVDVEKVRALMRVARSVRAAGT